MQDRHIGLVHELQENLLQPVRALLSLGCVSKLDASNLLLNFVSEYDRDQLSTLE